jgi:polyisoprenoid-binding protein YceI
MKTPILLAAFLIGALASAVGEEPAASRARYAIDAAHSAITWELPATLHTVRGSVPELSGSVEIETDREGAHAARGRVVVRAGAMKTGNESRDKTMREKVLETDAFPEIVFEADRVEADWSKLTSGAAFEAKVSGRLTVHGKALPLDVPVSVEPSGQAVVLSGSFPLRWKSYGLYDPSFGIVTVREPLRVKFRLTAVTADAAPK